MRADLAAQLAAIRDLDVDGLRRRWRLLSGKPAPASLPRALLIRMIAYCLQANAHGDLDRETRRVLDSIAKSLRDQPGRSGSVPPRPELRRLLPGTHLVREHGNVLHWVMVLEEGFAWNGSVYRSLSEVARSITGTRWNGYRFFGFSEPQRNGREPTRASDRVVLASGSPRREPPEGSASFAGAAP